MDRRKRTERLRHYQPYSKQVDYHSSQARECLFMAGNQLGKTLAGTAEDAMHLTGEYPDWWEGKRFSKPITMLAGSESYELTRDGLQRLLIGPPAVKDEWGTGMIPKRAILETTSRSGVPDALASVVVKHKSGGKSTLLFKAYEQGRAKWQANTVDYIHFDEEPPLDVYTEGLTRTNATGGFIRITFTPLKGMSDVVARFIMEENEDRETVKMTIDDVDHYSEEEKARIIASYPPHERDARTKGVPIMGSGLIFPVPEDDIRCDPFDIPKHWPQINGVDFGWDHPFGAVRCAWDRDNDVFYVCANYRQREATPILHAAAIKPWGDWIPVAWPHDGLAHDKGSGDKLRDLYAKEGLKMLTERATFEDGTNGVEAGLFDMLQRMQTGRWKVFSTCAEWFEEFRLYHREDGKVVKIRDDVMSASRYAYMMRRFAATKPTPQRPRTRNAWAA